LDMHGLSDLDSMMRSAETRGAVTAASHNSDWDRENFMAGGWLWCIRCAESMCLRRGRTLYEYREGRSAKPAARGCPSVRFVCSRQEAG
jgi:hypothetical protein